MDTPPMIEPTDDLTDACLAARYDIRRHATTYRLTVIDPWQPRPCPPNWRPT